MLLVSLLFTLYRVFAAVVFTALQLGRASSFAGDVSKAKVSAARIFSLLKLEPEIDSESPDGLKPVGSNSSCAVVIIIAEECYHNST